MEDHHVIDIQIFDDNVSSFLAVLYKHKQTTKIAGNNFLIFDTDFNIIFELIKSELYYTSISKWNSLSGKPGVIRVAFNVLLSNRIHLIKINITQVIYRRQILYLIHDHDLIINFSYVFGKGESFRIEIYTIRSYNETS